jgi:hypothetical protein
MKDHSTRRALQLALALVVSSGAQAATYDLFGEVGAFTQTGVTAAVSFEGDTPVSFLTITGPSAVTVNLTGFDFGFMPIVDSFSHLTLVSTANPLTFYDFGSPSGASISGHLSQVQAGSYYVMFDSVSGSLGGGFAGSAVVTPVPEPAAMAIALMGLAVFAGLYKRANRPQLLIERFV